ncbi:uncharacterized protein LOC119324351 [Triticum dicoccoides]|uniref:uncharacterized protein LOC119324351 n=1 Tax=Triticum dicoccoides TaxID=85692 RepID=UPI000E7A95A7|nr:uncharacterized protein LOC119324351 [Triticum dicoccoides]
MDVAASEFYNDKDKTYDLNFKEENNDDSLKISGDNLKNVYKSFVSEYPIGLIKDPVEQDDWMHYAKMTEEESLDYDFLVNNQMDHVLKASSQAKPEMTPYKRKVFQNGRTFSSIGPEPELEVPVVKQLIFCDDYEAQRWPLFPLKDCLLAGAILKPISLGGLFRKVDLQVFGNSVLGELGSDLLRHGSGLVTVNMMRGVNVSQLLKMDNILWSPSHRGIMFKSTCITDEEKDEEKDEENSMECPYNALRVLFNECLEASRGQTAEFLRTPLDVKHLLFYLEYAKSVDKRLINNHSAIRFPGDRIDRNAAANRFLRHTVANRLKRMRSGYCPDSIGAYKLESRVNLVFSDLSEVFPNKLFDLEGLHPLVNYWVREGQALRGIKKTTDRAPLERPLSADGKKIMVNSNEEKVELGKIYVALHRDPFEHLYGPARLWQSEYKVYDVEELINKVDPGYGPVLEESFLRHGFWPELDMDQNRPRHCYYTDVSWERIPREE